jgi:hypothetical protein
MRFSLQKKSSLHPQKITQSAPKNEKQKNPKIARFLSKIPLK